MTELEMKRAGVNTTDDVRIPPEAVKIFWNAAEIVGARLLRVRPKVNHISSFSITHGYGRF